MRRNRGEQALRRKGLSLPGAPFTPAPDGTAKNCRRSANCLRQDRRLCKLYLPMPDIYLKRAIRNWYRLTRLNWDRRYPIPIKLSVWGLTMLITPQRPTWRFLKCQYFSPNFVIL